MCQTCLKGFSTSSYEILGKITTFFIYIINKDRNLITMCLNDEDTYVLQKVKVWDGNLSLRLLYLKRSL